MDQSEMNQTSRRQFLKTSTAAAVSGVMAGPLVLTSRAAPDSPGEILRIGLIGCGGRGSGAVADALASDRNTVLHAMGDIDAGKIDGSLNGIKGGVKDETRLEVPSERRFVGLDAYEKVLASGVDVVLLTTPP